jgi:hypothetical protein
MIYTVIKHDGHLKIREKCEESDFNIFRVFSNVRRVLSQYETWLSLLYLLYDIDLYREKLRKAS